MAKQQNISNATKEMQDFNKESTTLVVTLQDLAKALKENASAASRFTGDSAGAYSAMFKDSVNLAKEMEGYTVGQLKNRQSEEAFLRKLSKLEQDRARVQSRIGYLQDKLVTSTGKELEYVKNSLNVLTNIENTLEKQVEHADDLKKTFEKISKEVKVFDDLSDFFKEIPGVSKVFGEFQKAADAARAAAAEGGNSFAAGAKELGGALVKTASAFAIATLVKGLTNADERTVNLSRNLNKSADQSATLVRNFNAAARGMQGLTGADIQNGATMLADSLGTTAISSISTSKELAAQTKYLGISADEAAKQAEFTQATGQDIAKTGSAMRGEVILSNLRNKTGIKYQSIMKDIANTSNATKLLMKGQGININQAAIEAKKLGTTLEGIGRTSASMLDFESSIANELEAELLTGQELNNEKARAAALRGDELTVAKEIQKNGVLEKFSAAKTVLERDAIAKAYGQTSESMGDMVVKSEAMKRMGASDQKDLEKKYSAQMKAIDAAKAAGNIAEQTRLESKLTAKIGDEELERQMKNQTFEEKKQEAMSKLAEAMDKMLPIIKAIAKVFEFIGTHAESLSKILLVIAGGAMLSKLGKLVGMFGKLGGNMSNAIPAAESIAEKVTQAAGKSAGAAGKATQAASKGAGGMASTAAKTAEAAGGGGGGFFSKIGSGLKNLVKGGKGLLSKMNPVTTLKTAMKEAGGFKGLLGKALKGSVLNTLLTGFFAYQDIKDLVQNPVNEDGSPLSGKQLNERVGKTVAGGLGGILGGILGTAVGGPIGSMVGSFGGQWLLEKMMGLFPEASEALGSVITPLSIWNDDQGKRPKVAMATGGIVTGPTNALVGEAGAEAVIPLREFYAKIDELIVAVKQGQNIYIGPNKLNEAIGLNLHPMR